MRIHPIVRRLRLLAVLAVLVALAAPAPPLSAQGAAPVTRRGITADTAAWGHTVLTTIGEGGARGRRDQIIALDARRLMVGQEDGPVAGSNGRSGAVWLYAAPGALDTAGIRVADGSGRRSRHTGDTTWTLGIPCRGQRECVTNWLTSDTERSIWATFRSEAAMLAFRQALVRRVAAAAPVDLRTIPPFTGPGRRALECVEAATPIRVGVGRSATLDETRGCRLGDGSYVHVYRLEPAESGDVRIHVRSHVFHPYVLVHDERGDVHRGSGRTRVDDLTELVSPVYGGPHYVVVGSRSPHLGAYSIHVQRAR